jgi:hypothetical protein
LQVFRNARDSVLGGKYTMKQQGGVRVVGHKRLIVTSAVPAGTLSFVNAYPALERLVGEAARALGVPGYSQSRLLHPSTRKPRAPGTPVTALKSGRDHFCIFSTLPTRETII